MRFGAKYNNGVEPNLKPAASLLDIIYLNSDNLTDIGSMFRHCKNLTKFTCPMNTEKVTGINFPAFQYCYRLEEVDATGWDLTGVTSLASMFHSCENLKTIHGLNTWDTKDVTGTGYMFYGCKSLTSLDVTNFNTSNVTSMHSMFYDCKSLTSLDVSNFDTSNVTSLEKMFYYCELLTSLDVSNWDTSKVTEMTSVFQNCKSLTSIDVSNWDTSKVISMQSMFSRCSNLTSIDVSNWDTSKVYNMRYILDYTHALDSINFGNLIINNKNAYYAFYDTNAKVIDISNITYNINDTENYYKIFGEDKLARNLTDIGMIHCDVETINIIAAQTPVQPITIWIGTHLTADEIASLDQYEHITYSVQLENADRLLLTSPLLEGDRIEVIDGQLCHVHNMAYYKYTTEKLKYFDINYAYKCIIPGYPGTEAVRHDQVKHTTRPINYIYWNSINRFNMDLDYIEGSTFEEKVQNFKDTYEGNELEIIFQLNEPYVEVIDLPRANIDIPLYENGCLYMSDPTASIEQVESNTNLIINAIQGDSVVNVSTQQFSVELSEETNTPIQTGEILEDNSIRPKFYGKTMVNLMDRINWSKYIEETKAGYSYDSTDITAKYITITNFNDKPIYVQINNIDDNTEVNSQVIAANETANININETSYLAGIYGLVADGWNGINIHEITNVNIFEGELSDDKLPENRMSGMRNAFDKYQTSDGKYRVEMVVSNSPIQFGKAGRK